MIFETLRAGNINKAAFIVSFSMSGSLKQGLKLSDSLSQMHALTTRLENLPYARFLAE